MTLEMTGPVIPADLTSLTLREQWDLHYDLIYRSHLTTWPRDAKLTISYPSGRPGKLNSAGQPGTTPYDSAHVNLDDRGAIWECLERFQAPPARPGLPGGNVWIGVAPRQAGLKVGQRGSGEECLGLPALWVDLDVLGGQHKRDDLPTRQVADQMIADCPYPPTLVLATGGGLHVYWACSELLDQGHAPTAGEPVVLTDAQLVDKALIGRHKAWWLDRAAELGVFVDRAPIASTPHPLRAAGSINGKYGTAVQVVFADPRVRYSRVELDAALPPLSVKTVASREIRETRTREIREAIDSGHARPGDRLAAEVPVTDLLLALGMTQAGANGWRSPDGGPGHPVHARVYSDAGSPEMVTAFDRSLRQAWGLADDKHSLDSFTLLGKVLCGGDWGLAARIAKGFSDDWPALLELVTERLEPSELAERYPSPPAPEQQESEDRPENGPANSSTSPSLTAVGEAHSSQARMAYRLAAQYAGKLLYAHGIGWLTWDGTRWSGNDFGAPTRAVLDVLRLALSGSLKNKKLRTDVGKCETGAGVAGVLTLASALEPFAATVADLDADPYLLNVANGTLDLRTMELRPHNPADKITKVTRAGWDSDAPTATWGTFLAQVLPDTEVREFLQRVAGVGLLGIVVEHVLPILTGTGSNGKGTFYKAVNHALGDYASTVEPDLFLHRQGAHPTGEMDLLGIRWCVVSETEKDRRLAEATMKRLTGGDTIRARRMKKDFVEFTPSHTAVMITNHLPKVSGDDPAIWRRLRVVPFDVVIPPAQVDKHMDERLQVDADAVLAWAVAGYVDYAGREELAEPVSVLTATDRYHKASDAVARFLDDRCIRNAAISAETAALFREWSLWSLDDGTEPISLRAFGEALDSHGFPVSKSHGRRVRRGIGLAEHEDAGF